MKKRTGKCCFCGRTAPTCWILPCLSLDTALRTEDDDAMVEWGRVAGVGIAKRGTAIVAPPRGVS
jgi:hypothetical protein